MATQEQLLAKAQAAIEALDQMSPKERELAPTPTYGNEYNKFRSQALKLHPSLGEVLPPPVEIFTPVQGGPITRARYVELHTYYKQINNLLHQQDNG